MLAAGIVQDTFAGEAVEGEGGEEETTGGYFYCYFYWYILPLRLESLPFFLALEFKSQNTHAHMRIRSRRTYNRRAKRATLEVFNDQPIGIYRKWFPLQGELAPLT